MRSVGFEEPVTTEIRRAALAGFLGWYKKRISEASHSFAKMNSMLSPASMPNEGDHLDGVAILSTAIFTF